MYNILQINSNKLKINFAHSWFVALQKQFIAKIVLLLTLIVLSVPVISQVDYGQYFTKQRFRFNYLITGSGDKQEIEPLGILKEKFWGGSQVQLIDKLKFGHYFLEISDEATGMVIYSRGFSDLFVEWQTTAEAKDTVVSYKQCLLFPAPKNSFILKVLRRNSSLQFELLYQQQIDPDSKTVQKVRKKRTSSKKLHVGGDYKKSLDIVFVSEGYTLEQKEAFFDDAEKFKDYLFNWTPYDKYKTSINLLAVFAPSKESGVDIPGDSIWVNSLLNSHFYTFGVERYLTLKDLTLVYDYLSVYPVDQVVVLVNSEKYGGGGMYNFYNIFTSKSKAAEKLFLHEFGHGFAALGDEYFNSEVAYDTTRQEMNSYEPFQTNVTNLVDFSLKWKDLINDTVPIPTPDTELYDKTIGVFEGANYVAKEYYRPYRNCMMRSFDVDYFCPVCISGINEMLQYYIK